MAKVTKKDMYAEFGIEFKSDKIKAPFGDNLYIPLLLPVGTNTKIGNAGTWSIYHGNETFNVSDFGTKTSGIMKTANIETITGSCPCHCKGCYCDAGRYVFDSVKSANMLKLIIARHYPDFMIRAINAQIAIEGLTQVRIHASGDFFSHEYVDAWVRIANANKNVTFWTYTKNRYALDVFQNVENVSIVPSITPYGFNFGTCTELLEMYRKLTSDGFKVHICACGTVYEKHCADCTTGCKAIGKECDFVLFIKHSADGYKAGKKDPDEFKAICEIIKNQTN